MRTLEGRNRRPNGHSHEVDLTSGEAQCPYCGQPISRKEFKELRARMVAEEAARSAKREQQIKDGFAREIAKAEASRKAEVEKARREATAAVEKKLKAVRENQEAVVAARVTAERERAAKKQAEAVNAEKLAHEAEKLRLEAMLGDLQRKLQSKTPHQLGEPGEIALHEAILGAFPEEQCRAVRVPKGQAGPDIIIEVLDHGVTVGSIIVDAKNHAKWSSRFIAKLKSDQRVTSADWAILASNTYPKDSAKGLCVVDGIIVSDPAYVVTLVGMLRRQIIEVYRQRLTAQARDETAAALLTFIASPGCADLLGQFAKVSDGFLALEDREISTHKATWGKRAALINSLQAAHADLLAAIDRIIGGSAGSALEEVVA
jgi:hypothetical protein